MTGGLRFFVLYRCQYRMPVRMLGVQRRSTIYNARRSNSEAASIATLTKIDHTKFHSYFEKRLDEIRSPFCSIAARVRDQSKLTTETKIDLACFSPILRPSTDGVWARPSCAATGCRQGPQNKPASLSATPGRVRRGGSLCTFPLAPFPSGNCAARRAPCARARRGLTIKPCCCASQIL